MLARFLLSYLLSLFCLKVCVSRCLRVSSSRIYYYVSFCIFLKCVFRGACTLPPLIFIITYLSLHFLKVCVSRCLHASSPRIYYLCFVLKCVFRGAYTLPPLVFIITYPSRHCARLNLGESSSLVGSIWWYKKRKDVASRFLQSFFVLCITYLFRQCIRWSMLAVLWAFVLGITYLVQQLILLAIYFATHFLWLGHWSARA